MLHWVFEILIHKDKFGSLAYIPPFWPGSSVGGAMVIKSEGCGFKFQPGQSFSLSLCGSNSSTRVDPRWNDWEYHFTVVLGLTLT